MQMEPQEASGAKASTELNEMRLISVDQLNKIHRELDACQKAIWLAGCRPSGYGFDPAYVSGAQEQLKVIEALLSQAPNWSTQKPTCAGAYWIRGFRLDKPDARSALVEVAINETGTLVCNIHDSNTNDETREWSFVEDLAERFEWFGPLGAPVAEPENEAQDSLYRKAVEVVIKNQRGSTSFLMRYFQIGYNRAASLIEYMELQGIISGIDGDGSRKVLMLEVPHA